MLLTLLMPSPGTAEPVPDADQALTEEAALRRLGLPTVAPHRVHEVRTYVDEDGRRGVLLMNLDTGPAANRGGR